MRLWLSHPILPTRSSADLHVVAQLLGDCPLIPHLLGQECALCAFSFGTPTFRDSCFLALTESFEIIFYDKIAMLYL